MYPSRIFRPPPAVPSTPILSRSRRWLYVSALVVVLGLLAGCGGDDAASDVSVVEPNQRTSPVAAVDVAPRDLSRQIDLVGTVRPRLAVRIPSRMRGTLLLVRVEEGDRVEAGELLARFDTAEQSAELNRAEAEEIFARTEFSYMERLRATDAVSRNELERARVTLTVAEAERQLWQTRADFGEVRAPRAGVISGRHVEPGEAVDAQEVLFELVALDQLVLRAQVSELDVVHLSPGQTARVRVDALPKLELEGRIGRIFPTADASSRLVTVELMLPPDATNHGVRPGFLARVRLQVDRRESVLAVPAVAVGENGSERFVFVINGDVLERRTVEPGVTRAQWTEVTSGLEAGDVVLATNPADMRVGARVRIVGWRD